MLSVLLESAMWAWGYVQHVLLMFYWFWIPGLFVIAFLSTRYRPVFERITLKRHDGIGAFWAAIGWGMTSSAGRRGSLEAAVGLWRQGLPDRIVLAHLVASQSLMLYSLLLLTILIGLEFGLGVFLGGLMMAGFLWFFAPAQGTRGGLHPHPTLEADTSIHKTWTDLLRPATGWGRIVRHIGRYLRNVGLSLVGGLILGSLILTIDTRGKWFLPTWMGDETLEAAIVGSFLAPVISMLFFLTPGGNLIVASSIWKTWTLTYQGLISFVLSGLLNPLTVRTLLRLYGGRRGWQFVLAIYLSAALSGLAVAGLFWLVGVKVTHVPWFRDLVDKLMMVLPFTMLGTPGGGRM